MIKNLNDSLQIVRESQYTVEDLINYEKMIADHGWYQSTAV